VTSCRAKKQEEQIVSKKRRGKDEDLKNKNILRHAPFKTISLLKMLHLVTILVVTGFVSFDETTENLPQFCSEGTSELLLGSKNSTGLPPFSAIFLGGLS